MYNDILIIKNKGKNNEVSEVILEKTIEIVEWAKTADIGDYLNLPSLGFGYGHPVNDSEEKHILNALKSEFPKKIFSISVYDVSTIVKRES